MAWKNRGAPTTSTPGMVAGAAAQENLQLLKGTHIFHEGQTGNRVSSNVANQGVGTVAMPALAAAATANVTVSDTKVTALSLILFGMRTGTTTPAAGASYVAFVSTITPGTSFVVTVHNPASASGLATDFELHYMLVN